MFFYKAPPSLSLTPPSLSLTCFTILCCREECPDKRLPLTLRSLFPSPSFLPPHLTTSTNSLFSITSQWAPSSYYHVRYSSTIAYTSNKVYYTVILAMLCNCNYMYAQCNFFVIVRYEHQMIIVQKLQLPCAKRYSSLCTCVIIDFYSMKDTYLLIYPT